MAKTEIVAETQLFNSDFMVSKFFKMVLNYIKTKIMPLILLKLHIYFLKTQIVRSL